MLQRTVNVARPLLAPVTRVLTAIYAQGRRACAALGGWGGPAIPPQAAAAIAEPVAGTSAAALAEMAAEAAADATARIAQDSWSLRPMWVAVGAMAVVVLDILGKAASFATLGMYHIHESGRLVTAELWRRFLPELRCNWTLLTSPLHLAAALAYAYCATLAEVMSVLSAGLRTLPRLGNPGDKGLSTVLLMGPAGNNVVTEAIVLGVVDAVRDGGMSAAQLTATQLAGLATASAMLEASKAMSGAALAQELMEICGEECDVAEFLSAFAQGGV